MTRCRRILFQFVGILIDGDDFHLGTAFRTHEGIQLVDLREKPGLGAFARIDVDLFIPIRQWLVARIICDRVKFVGGFR